MISSPASDAPPIPANDGDGGRGPSEARFRLAGIAGVVLGVGYAVFVRFYQAAGGTIGLEGPRPPGLNWASYTAGVAILVGAAACAVLTIPSLRVVPEWSPIAPGRRAPRRLVIAFCVVPTLISAVIAASHGLGGEVAKALEALGVGVASIHADAPASSASELMWELAFYEPWFVAFGVCLGMSALGYLRQERVRLKTRRAVARTLIVLTVLTAAVVVLSMMLHWPLDATPLLT